VIYYEDLENEHFKIIEDLIRYLWIIV